jgi:hypothetical protein
MPNQSNRRPKSQNGFQLKAITEEPEGPVTDQPPAAAFDDLGALPRSYGIDTLFLIAQEPHWLFTYWDIDISKHPGGPTFLRYCHENGNAEGEIEVPFETRNWYIPVQHAAHRYFVEIGFYRGTAWNPIARSVTVETPPERISVSDNFDFATVPFHLTFQNLVEQIQASLRAGETLLETLAKLQHRGDLSAFGGLPLQLSSDQRNLLETILGPKLLEELAASGLSSEEMQSRIRAYLEERLHSEGAGELIGQINAVLPLSSLFSGGFAPAGASEILGSESVTSWSAAAFSSWAAETLSSWMTAAVSSWSAAETSSWSAAPSGLESAGAALSSGAFASWLQRAESSWGAAALSSWLQAAQASWFQAAQASWAEAALSSWSAAPESSWLAAGSSSWGGSESIGSFSLPTDRGFFLRLNGEVVFHGAADPSARVTVGGKEIALNPDGTFRCHFSFPSEDCEIPIIATAPDGQEIRRATLTFSRPA